MGGPAAPQTRPRGKRSTPQQVARGVRMPERRGSSARKKSQHALPLLPLPPTGGAAAPLPASRMWAIACFLILSKLRGHVLSFYLVI